MFSQTGLIVNLVNKTLFEALIYVFKWNKVYLMKD